MNIEIVEKPEPEFKVFLDAKLAEVGVLLDKISAVVCGV